MLTHPYRSPSARVLQSPRGLTHDPATAQIRSSRKPRGQRRPCCSRVLSPSSARGGYQSTSGGQAVHGHASAADILYLALKDFQNRTSPRSYNAFPKFPASFFHNGLIGHASTGEYTAPPIPASIPRPTPLPVR
jgi:hypothetical protein